MGIESVDAATLAALLATVVSIACTWPQVVRIRRTGDIFFPRNWMDALLSGHNSAEAAITVRTFLQESPDYPARLRRIILQTADPLFRATAEQAGRP